MNWSFYIGKLYLCFFRAPAYRVEIMDIHAQCLKEEAEFLVRIADHSVKGFTCLPPYPIYK